LARLGRLSWKQIAISAGSVAFAGCFAVLLAPFLPGPALAAAHAGPLVVVVSGPAADDSPVRFEPGSLLAMSEWGEKVPAEQQVPKFTLPGARGGAVRCRGGRGGDQRQLAGSNRGT
jgi:hypothetical protein